MKNGPKLSVRPIEYHLEWLHCGEISENGECRKEELKKKHSFDCEGAFMSSRT
jgi:hypothetical protein